MTNPPNPRIFLANVRFENLRLDLHLVAGRNPTPPLRSRRAEFNTGHLENARIRNRQEHIATTIAAIVSFVFRIVDRARNRLFEIIAITHRDIYSATSARKPESSVFICLVLTKSVFLFYLFIWYVKEGRNMVSLQLPEKEGITYGDYLQWTDDRRRELIDGVVYDMGPAPAIDHQRVVGDLFSQIFDHLKDKPCEVFVAPCDVRLPKADEADELVKDVVQPDIVVVCDLEKLDRRGCRGAPDWIVEILSPSTAVKDRNEKLALYERAGVKEYWIVHPVYRMIDVYLPGPDGIYGRPKSYSDKDRVESFVLPGFRANLKELFDGMLFGGK